MRNRYEDEGYRADWTYDRDRDEWRLRGRERSGEGRGDWGRSEPYDRDYGRGEYGRDWGRDYGYGQSRWAGDERYRGFGEYRYPHPYESSRWARGPVIVGDARRPRQDETFGERIGDVSHRMAHGIRKIFRGPKGYKRADERIREDVCDRLNDLAQTMEIDLGDVEISVKDAEVVVSGMVDERRIKRMVDDTIDDCAGVMDVHNQLRVRPQEEAPQRATTATGDNGSRGRIGQNQAAGR